MKNDDLLRGLRFYISTLGCKVNQHESQLMAAGLTEMGMIRQNDPEGADVCVINSCTVTATADQKTRQTLHRLRRMNPDAIICMTGCVPQACPEKADALTDADIIIGNSNREVLREHIIRFIGERQRIIDIQPHTPRSGLTGGIADFGERTRAYIKIEDGCNRFCAYCMIPYARGRVRSRSLADIGNEAAALAQSCSEVVLVGINLSAYGQDCGLSLADAVRTVAAVPGIERIRLGSVEPDLLTPELFELLAAEPKFCPQFHMSIQSGCDGTLERMRRRYDTTDYTRLVEAIRARFDNPSITTDIMVGFPGETGEEFAASLAYFRSVGYARAHCFAYSPREGTVAAAMPEQIDAREKNRRAAVMLEAATQSTREFLSTQIGTTAQVLAERQLPDGRWEGYSKNYTHVIFSGDVERGGIYSVLLTDVQGESCVGEAAALSSL